MTLTELRYAVALAETRHFGRAASACFISQPTLSIAVKRLEATLAVTLFERGSSEVTLTEAGEKTHRIGNECANEGIPRDSSEVKNHAAPDKSTPPNPMHGLRGIRWLRRMDHGTARHGAHPAQGRSRPSA